MGGSYSTINKRKQGCALNEELMRRIRELKGEVMDEREKQRHVYERKMQEKEAEWNKEREMLEDQVSKFKHLKVVAARKVLTSDETKLKEDVSGRRTDDTAERWKKLYKLIKAELDELILRTQNSGVLVYDMNMLQYLKTELREKENTIEALKAKIITMEKEESKKAREVDILRQSLRIIMNSTKISKTTHLMKTAKSLSRLQDRIYNDSKSTGYTNAYEMQKVRMANQNMNVHCRGA